MGTGPEHFGIILGLGAAMGCQSVSNGRRFCPLGKPNLSFWHPWDAKFEARGTIRSSCCQSQRKLGCPGVPFSIFAPRPGIQKLTILGIKYLRIRISLKVGNPAPVQARASFSRVKVVKFKVCGCSGLLLQSVLLPQSLEDPHLPPGGSPSLPSS